MVDFINALGQLLLPHHNRPFGRSCFSGELEVERGNAMTQPRVVLIDLPAEVGVKFKTHVEGL
jgi:hypothetical protein